MAAKFFNNLGICLIGSNTKGKHWSEISESWCQWACKEIEGFKYQYLVAKNKPKPKPVTSFQTTGRTYLIKRKRN